MGAVPKNKITRAERGKRRHGNRPFLVKDAHSSVPNHKRGFVSDLLKFVGLDSSTPSTAVATTRADQKAEKTNKSTSMTAVADRKSQKNTALASKSSTKIVAPRTTSK